MRKSNPIRPPSSWKQQPQSQPVDQVRPLPLLFSEEVLEAAHVRLVEKLGHVAGHLNPKHLPLANDCLHNAPKAHARKGEGGIFRLASQRFDRTISTPNASLTDPLANNPSTAVGAKINSADTSTTTPSPAPLSPLSVLLSLATTQRVTAL